MQHAVRLSVGKDGGVALLAVWYVYRTGVQGAVSNVANGAAQAVTGAVVGAATGTWTA